MKKALSLVLTMCIVLSLFATFVVSASAEEAVNLAAGKTYTVANAYNRTENYPDSGNELTNGKYAASSDYSDPEYTGFVFYDEAGNRNADFVAANYTFYVTVDLGKVSVIESIVASYSTNAENGVMVFKGADVALSADGTTWGESITATYNNETGKINADVSGEARYVKFGFSTTDTAEQDSWGAWVMLDELEVWGTEKKAEVEWKPFFLSHFDNTGVEGAGVVFTDNATNTNYAWRVHAVFAPIAGEENAYEIVDIIDYLATDATKVTKTPVIPEGGFAYNLNYGNDYPSINMDGPDYTSPNCNNMIADVLTWKVGDKFMFKNLDLVNKTVPTSTEGTNWYDDAYVCTAQYAAYVPGYSEGEEPETIVETITVDGNLNDTGWNKDKWITVNDSNGYWQNADSAGDSLEYKYQIRADEEKVYVAVEVNETKQVRFWVKDDAADEDGNPITVYTHFYDVVISEADGQLNVTTTPRYNTSTTENKGNSVTDAPWTDSSFEAKVTKDGKYYVEMSFDADEFASDGEFEYYICVFDTDSNCLYSRVVPVETEDHPLVVAGKAGVRLVNLPYNIWYSQNTTVVDVEAIQLGEVVVTPEEPAEEPDTSMMGTAPSDSKFTATVSGPEAWKAGDKITVDVTIEVTADELELSQIMFNLFYDAADVEITLPENLGTLVTEGPDSWKGEDSLFTLTTSGDYGVIEAAPATVEAEDALKKGDKIVISFEFTVKEEAEGLINFQLSNEELNGFTFAAPMTAIAGTGSSLAIAPAGDNLGDAGIYAIAALAIVALIGTAVVIKKRA